MNIGNRVKMLREQKGMTQEELATKLGYKSKSSVAHIEGGRDIPRSMVVTLADILDTTPSYLMGWYDSVDIPINEKIDTITADESALLHHLQKTYADEDLEVLSSLNRNQAAEIVEQAKKMKLGE